MYDVPGNHFGVFEAHSGVKGQREVTLAFLFLSIALKEFESN